MSVRVSPISRGAALLIVVIGLITFVYIDPIAGVAFLVLGLVLYWLLYRFARKLGKEIGEAKKS